MAGSLLVALTYLSQAIGAAVALFSGAESPQPTGRAEH
jgi:hypothetical protein